MRLLLLILISYSSNILSNEDKNNNLNNFFDKEPAVQRQIFIEKLKKILPTKVHQDEETEISNQIRSNNKKTVESLLVESLELISNGRLGLALNTIDELITLVPNFQLAHLIRGDILTAYSMSIKNFGGSAIEINSDKVTELHKEAKRRIKGYLIAQNNYKAPKFNIIPKKNDEYLIYVDMDSSRLFIFENNEGQYSYTSDYYISIGKNGYGKRFEGDKKTPYGTYFLQKKIERDLTDFYGSGAYPIDYPNEFDKLNKFTGSGIWIHGTPKSTYSRPPEASDGCVVLANKDIDAIKNILNTPGTPVILSNVSITDLSFRSAGDIKIEQTQLLGKIKKWEESWAATNFKRYIDFYSNDAKYNNINFKEWSLRKKNVFRKSKDVRISIKNISIYEYPSLKDQLRIVMFDQDYTSNLIKNSTRKKQIWKLNNGAWKIIYEGTK